MGDVHRVTDGQSDLAVYSGPGIPARAMFARVGFDRNHVRLSKLHKRSGVDAKRHVAIVPSSCQLAVHVDFGKRHHTVEIKIDLAALVLALQFDRLAIPTDTTPRQFARITALGRIKGTGDCPVVGHRDCFPVCIVVAWLLHIFGLFSLGESPTVRQHQLDSTSLRVGRVQE